MALRFVAAPVIRDARGSRGSRGNRFHVQQNSNNVDERHGGGAATTTLQCIVHCVSRILSVSATQRKE